MLRITDAFITGPARANPAPFIVLLLGLLLCLPTPAREPSSVVVQLSGQHQFRFAGYYAAIAQGYYRDAGLEVILREAGPATDVTTEVVSGRAQFGIGNSALLLARQRGKPVVVLATPFQHAGLQLLTRAGIHSVHHLAGQQLILAPGAEALLAYLQREGVPLGQLHLDPSPPGVEALIFGKVDAISTESADDSYTLMQSGYPYGSFSPRSAGIDFYGDNLFTSERELSDHGSRVAAFRAASLKGWRYAMAHPDEMVAWILTQAPGQGHSGLNRNKLLFQASQVKELIQADLVEIGTMYPGRWQHIAETYLALGLLDTLPNLNDFLYPQRTDSLARQQWLQYQHLAIGVGVLLLLLILTRLVWRLDRQLRQGCQQRKKLLAKIAANERHFRFITENSVDVIWTLDIASQKLTYLSPSIQQLRGFTAAEVMAQSDDQRMSPDSLDRLTQQLKDALSTWTTGDHTHTRRVTQLDLPHKDGHIINAEVVTTLHGDSDGNPVAVLGVIRDISDRQNRDDMMRQLAFLDPLTQLPNRRLLQDRLQLALQQAGERTLALLFIDLDHFKPVNDLHGHEAGDWLLATVAKRMQHCVREGDTVARIGGDEFVILLTDIADEQAAMAIAQAIHTSLNQTFAMTEALQFQISSCIGVALYPQHGTNQKQLMNHGDQAMYQAKESGRNRIQLYQPPEACCPSPQQNPPLQLNWKHSHHCGHPQLDKEHHQLFALANQLLNSVLLMEGDPAQFHHSVADLLSLANHHFAHEEAILASLAYPDLAEHRQEHQRLLIRANTLYQTACANTLDTLDTVALLEFVLQELILGHMIKQDRRYFPLLQASLQQALTAPVQQSTPDADH